MNDNISRKAAAEAIQHHFNPTGAELPVGLASVLAGVGVVIATMPSTDAVQVVRCGQCEHWKCNPNTNEYGVCNKVSYDEFEVVMDSDDFCSYGRKKGGDTNAD